jgi:hypothetical protein
MPKPLTAILSDADARLEQGFRMEVKFTLGGSDEAENLLRLLGDKDVQTKADALGVKDAVDRIIDAAGAALAQELGG